MTTWHSLGNTDSMDTGTDKHLERDDETHRYTFILDGWICSYDCLRWQISILFKSTDTLRVHNGLFERAKRNFLKFILAKQFKNMVLGLDRNQFTKKTHFWRQCLIIDGWKFTIIEIEMINHECPLCSTI